MSTNISQIQEDVEQVEPTEAEQNLAGMVDALQDVDTQAPNAELNATSISDNNGGRIELNEDLAGPNVIKK